MDRAVEQIINPTATSDGAGVKLARSIATPTLDHLDPFFLFDHFGSENPKDYLAGFPMHPHRGIETITYMLDGSVSHRDSLGNSGTIGTGDVQWMTAGRGIMHEEMPHFGAARMEGFQIWVNMPRTLKMSAPRYQDVPAVKIPELTRGEGSRIRVVAGTIEGVHGAVREIYAEPTYLDVHLPKYGTFEHLLPTEHTAIFYVYRGSIRVGSYNNSPPVGSPHLVVLGPGDRVYLSAGVSGAKLLLLSAQPLREPAFRYGPFVMNTREEIMEAIAQLRAGTFVNP
jgi:redox-sensitive bicupin YhaK (pirin superfamily)